MRISAGVDFRPNGGMLAFARMEYVIATAPFKQLACHFPSSLFLIAFSPGALLRSLLLYLYIVSGSPPERGVHVQTLSAAARLPGAAQPRASRRASTGRRAFNMDGRRYAAMVWKTADRMLGFVFYG